MQAELSSLRRVYELGRLRTSLRRALYVLVPVTLVAFAVTGRDAAAWLPVTFAVWVFAHWRGGPLLRGAFFGLVGGLVTYALPMTLLRPCCAPEAMAQAAAAGRDCCTMPGACLGVGAALGMVMALFVPAGPSRWRTAAGMGLGVASVAILRCATLFAGEAVGLVGGLVAGVLAATMAQLFVGARERKLG